MIVALAMAVAMSHLPPPVRGDFDRDGKPDTAQVVAGPEHTYRLVVTPGDPHRQPTTIDTFSEDELQGLKLGKERAGRLKTWCGKGGGVDDDPCPYRAVVLPGETLSYGTPWSSEWIAIWNGHRFERVLISD